jgi:hypothetical protein
MEHCNTFSRLVDCVCAYIKASTAEFQHITLCGASNCVPQRSELEVESCGVSTSPVTVAEQCSSNVLHVYVGSQKETVITSAKSINETVICKLTEY